MRKFRIWLLGFVVCCISAMMWGCSDNEWDRADQKALMKRCMAEGGSKSYCKCYLKNAMEEYPDASEIENIDFESAVELSLGCEE